jgi:heme A synthase
VSDAPSVMQRRIRCSGLLVLLGLGVEVATLLWRSPLSFFVFMIVGGALVALGIVTFLLSLVSPEARREA